MSDPLSVIASVAGLVSISAGIASLAKQLYDSAKDAPESISRIREEMDHMRIIYSEVKSLLTGDGKHRPSKSRLTMLSIHNLLTILSGCVLACSRLDKKLNEVAGIQAPGVQRAAQNSASRVIILARVKWALWTEAEARSIIGDLQRYKTSLHMMLTIMQCKSTAEAAETQAKLYNLVERISESGQETALQMRELIRRHQEEPLQLANESSGASITSTTHVSNDFDDGASIRTRATAVSTRSIRSIVPVFTEELKSSRVYKRLRRSGRDSDSQSVFSKATGDAKGDTWSMLSDLSLGDLSVSEISVLELPICLSDLYDASAYQNAQQGISMKRFSKRGAYLKWSSRGRLHNAIDAKNTFVLRTLLNLGADIEEVYDGCTPLSYAIKKGEFHICHWLVAKGATVHVTDSSGRTPLSCAAREGDIEMCEWLVGKGSTVNSADFSGRTPLSYAAGQGNFRTCMWLVDKGATIDYVDSSGRTPLSYAAEKGSLRTCQFLADNGATVGSVDFSGRAPLSYAASKGGVGICQWLMKRGEDVNSVDSSGRTPLSYAAKDGSLDVCRWLVKHGGTVDGSCARGQSLLDAVSRGKFGISLWLIDNGIRVNSMDFYGRTPLSYAATGGDVDICRWLIDNGANVDSVDNSGRTPLSYAAEEDRNLDICEFLVRKGAKVSFMDSSGRTPLSYAAEKNMSPGVCMLLKRRGAKVSSMDSSGRTPLSYAAEKGRLRICSWLMRNGANVNSVDFSGRTPLSYAAEKNVGICRLLVRNGAKVNSVDSSGRTPLSYAANNRYRLIFQFLIDHGAHSDANPVDSSGRRPLSYSVETRDYFETRDHLVCR